MLWNNAYTNACNSLILNIIYCVCVYIYIYNIHYYIYKWLGYEVHLTNTGFEVDIFYSKFDSFKFDNRYI